MMNKNEKKKGNFKKSGFGIAVVKTEALAKHKQDPIVAEAFKVETT